MRIDIKSLTMKPILKTLLFITLIFTFSCKKENSNDFVNVTVVDRGEVAVDGCGWWIMLDDGTE